MRCCFPCWEWIFYLSLPSLKTPSQTRPECFLGDCRIILPTPWWKTTFRNSQQTECVSCRVMWLKYVWVCSALLSPLPFLFVPWLVTEIIWSLSAALFHFGVACPVPLPYSSVRKAPEPKREECYKRTAAIQLHGERWGTLSHLSFDLSQLTGISILEIPQSSCELGSP